MAHEHNEECDNLHEALKSLQAQQQLPRSSMSTMDGGMVLPDRAVEPEGDTADVEVEIAKVRQALAALECDR